jgi:hypothetical protein
VAGAKSSSLSSCNLDCMTSSSSSDSTTTFLRVAALREGLTGDSDILNWEGRVPRDLYLVLSSQCGCSRYNARFVQNRKQC